MSINITVSSSNFPYFYSYFNESMHIRWIRGLRSHESKMYEGADAKHGINLTRPYNGAQIFKEIRVYTYKLELLHQTRNITLLYSIQAIIKPIVHNA